MQTLEQVVKILSKYYPVFLEGLVGTLWISAVTVVLGSLLGLVIALMKMNKRKPLNLLASFYIEVIRGTPILLQLYFFWLWLPKATGIDLSNTQCIIVALIVNSGAYVAEVIRAGIEAVDMGQTEAAKSLGLSDGNTMRYIIMPQAIKNILPALCNEFINMIKQTSLASIFFVSELMTSWKTVQSTTFLSIPPLIIVGMVYLVVNYSLSRLVKVFERRLKESDR